MIETLIEDQAIERKDFSGKAVLASEYENCSFTECDFTKSDLSKTVFVNCAFDNCNFSNANVSNTLFNDVKFHNCKLLGVKFSESNSLVVSLYFEECQLNMASFYKLKLRGIIFKNCSLQDVDFTEADLTNSVFDNCDMLSAMFDHTTLKNADLRSSLNYSIDPEQNQIKKAKFSIFGLVGLLEKYDILVE